MDEESKLTDDELAELEAIEEETEIDEDEEDEDDWEDEDEDVDELLRDIDELGVDSED